MSLSTLEISQTTNPSKFLLEGDTAGVFDTISKESSLFASIITGSPSHKIVKTCHDGIQIFCLFSDHIEMWWRRNLDENPIKVFNWSLRGRVYYSDDWQSWQIFDFSPANITTVEAGVSYEALQTETGYGTSYNYFGFTWEFLRRGIDHKFFLYSENNPCELQWILEIRDAALAENRNGFGVPLLTQDDVGADDYTATADTPVSDWTRYKYTWTRSEACESVDGRTAKQLFAQDAGISVR